MKARLAKICPLLPLVLLLVLLLGYKKTVAFTKLLEYRKMFIYTNKKMKILIKIFVLLNLLISCSAKSEEINLKTKERMIQKITGELNASYGKEFELADIDKDVSIWNQDKNGKDVVCCNLKVYEKEFPGQSYLVSVDSQGNYKDSLHLLPHVSRLKRDFENVLKSKNVPWNLSYRFEGLLRGKKYLNNADFEVYMEKMPFETWVTVYLNCKLNENEYVPEIKEILRIFYDEIFEKYNVSVEIKTKEDEKTLYIQDLNQYEGLNPEHFTDSEILNTIALCRYL